MLEKDVSYNARAEFYNEMAFYAITNFFGDGMGAVGLSQRLSNGTTANTTFDNGFLEMLVTLGWVGSILYMYSFFFFFKKALTVFSKSNDALLACFSVIVISVFIQMIFSNRFIGPVGFFYFLFFGFLISGYVKKFHVDKFVR
ncbi:MAG: hypothetical protein JKY14_03085 [Paraglaciecola sp.]|nr:hypothetical protein [Paraglaciecola sp.]